MRATVRLLLVGGLLLGLAAPVGAETPSPPQVSMSSGILVDASSGRVLWAHEPDVPRPPASLTKMLTALVVIERADLEDTATITPEARNAPGARLYAEEGWTLPVRDLLWGLLLESGNDAAVALAQKVSPDGSLQGFAALMNERAAAMGAQHSSFRNPHGLDEPGHVSTARDLALIAATALRNPVLAEIVASRSHEIGWNGGHRILVNHNKLLWRYAGAIGVKTGYTGGAGHCLASAARRGDDTILAVMLDVTNGRHYAASSALYDWGFSNLPALREASGVSIYRSPVPRSQQRVRTAFEDAPAVPATAADAVVAPDPALVRDSVPVTVPLVALLVATVIGSLTLRQAVRSRAILLELTPAPARSLSRK
ncbi:MAG: D-alanyl-D-alanine carboxypeptidase family protein [Actinomycetota bacterium]